MKNFIKNPNILWYLLLIGFGVVLFSLWVINNVIKNLRDEEAKQVELWAKAISRKSDMVKQTQEFYNNTLKVEQKELQRFVEAYKIIMSMSEDVNLSSPELKFYTDVIMDNKNIPLVITDEFNNILFTQNIDPEPKEKVLVGDLYKKFTRNKPLEYETYGMKFRLYYTESNVFSNLQAVTDKIIYSFLDEITNNGVSAPVIITDSTMRNILAYGNMDKDKVLPKNMKKTIESLLDNDNTAIKIALPDNDYGYIIFEKNKTVSILQYFPILLLSFFILFACMLFLVLRTIKSSERNLVWVGMGKETAHQLGTPISSLMAWVEILRSNPENKETCQEMDKDIERLNIISQRFSHIGSKPDLKVQDVISIIDNVVRYMSSRCPKKITFINNAEHHCEVLLPVNQFLMEWSLENIFKNAIDAMKGTGTISISFTETTEKLYIDISDTGKGMSKSMFKKIFQPGFTTKKRGWGMGLSLVRRVIEDYHNGKVYVKNSVPETGTTFRIELNK